MKVKSEREVAQSYFCWFVFTFINIFCLQHMIFVLHLSVIKSFLYKCLVLFKEKVKKTVIHLVCGYGKKKQTNMDMGVSAFRETLGVLKGTQRYQTFNSIYGHY